MQNNVRKQLLDAEREQKTEILLFLLYFFSVRNFKKVSSDSINTPFTSDVSNPTTTGWIPMKFTAKILHNRCLNPKLWHLICCLQCLDFMAASNITFFSIWSLFERSFFCLSSYFMASSRCSSWKMFLQSDIRSLKLHVSSQTFSASHSTKNI